MPVQADVTMCRILLCFLCVIACCTTPIFSSRCILKCKIWIAGGKILICGCKMSHVFTKCQSCATSYTSRQSCNRPSCRPAWAAPVLLGPLKTSSRSRMPVGTVCVTSYLCMWNLPDIMIRWGIAKCVRASTQKAIRCELSRPDTGTLRSRPRPLRRYLCVFLQEFLQVMP